MLGKLLKYEMKATARTFLPIYIALLCFAILEKLVGRNALAGFEKLNFAGEITAIILIALFVALVVVTIVVTIQRFYKNLLRDEGYLMFTLPVTTRSLILSKLLVTCIWAICSVIVSAGVFAILFAGYADFWNQVQMVIQEILRAIREGGSEFIIKGGLAVSLTVLVNISNILMMYLALAISQFSFAHKHRVAVAFIAYIVLNIGVGQCSSVMMMAVRDLSVSGVMGLAVFGSIILIVALFEAINYILKNQLNLE